MEEREYILDAYLHGMNLSAERKRKAMGRTDQERV